MAQVLLSGTLTFGVPLLLAIRELLMLRRGRRGGGWPSARRRDPRPGPMPPGGDPIQRPLPACLVPVLPPRSEPAWKPVRELEEV
ncbi:MAG TPA: hypothetical protein VHS58_02085 [Acetobacteraceae bacterium]|nr:hypothetical protein [Acetobacteraceae bacterium]